MVQETLLDALDSWRIRGVPENPSGWVHHVARNKILDALRRGRAGERALRVRAESSPAGTATGLDELFDDAQIADSQLRMIFACCDPRLARADQVALTLKALCGFGHAEIARAFLVSEEAIKKRLQRATRELVERDAVLEAPRDGSSWRDSTRFAKFYIYYSTKATARRAATARSAPICAKRRRGSATCCARSRGSRNRGFARSWRSCSSTRRASTRVSTPAARSC